VETAMFTLPYNPVAVVPRIVGGLLSGLIFKSSRRSSAGNLIWPRR